MSQRKMRFTVTRIHSQYVPRFSLALIGTNSNGNYIMPRYILKQFGFEELEKRAAELNSKIPADKLLTR